MAATPGGQHAGTPSESGTSERGESAVSQDSKSPASPSFEKPFEDAAPKTVQEAIGLVMEQRRSPYPEPDEFAAYEAVKPGSAQEILDGARENRHHRFAMDHKVANTARLSLVLTFAAVLAFVGAAVFLATQGHLWLAALFGLGGFAPVLAGMIRGGGHWSGKAPGSG